MTDEQTNSKPVDAPVVEQSQPVDAPAEQNPAHPVDENPEEHLGEVLDDPWDDENQTDWPNGTVELPGVSN